MIIFLEIQMRKYIDPFLDALKKCANNETVLYQKKSLYPALQLDVISVERSRDDIGALEMTILKLLNAGIKDLNSLAKLVGLGKPDKLRTIVDKLIGYGVIARNGETLSITDIGLLSIQTGHQMIETSVSLLLCGITGKLLPRQMYDAKIIESPNLRQGVRFKYLLDESERISLQALDLQDINKRAHNIKDETVFIKEVEEYKQVFLESQIVISANARDLKAEISINNEPVNWDFNAKALMQNIYLDAQTLEVEAYIRKFMQDLGLNASISPLDLRLSLISVNTVKKELLSVKMFSNHPLLAYVGRYEDSDNLRQPVILGFQKIAQTKPHPAILMCDFFLDTQDESIINLAAAYRKLILARGNYNKQKGDLKAYLKTAAGECVSQLLPYVSKQLKDILA